MDPYALAAVMHRSLHALDRMERDVTADRLTVVADLVTQALGLPGWSAFSAGAGVVPQMVLRHLLRRTDPPPERFEVRLGPVIDGFGLHATRTAGPHALRRRVENSGLREILVVGGYAPDATRWVLECYEDRADSPLESALPAVYAVVQAVLSFPQPSRPTRIDLPDTGRHLLIDLEAYRSRDAE